MQVGIQDGDSHICQFEGCTEMDVLSARCSNCGKNFCSQHLNGFAHHCQSIRDERVATCPVCARAVPPEYPQQPMDEAVSRHIDRGCKDVPQPVKTSSTAVQAPLHPLLATLFPGAGQRLGGAKVGANSANRCTAAGCGRVEEVRIVCDLCGKVFCIEHRNPADHNCPGRRLTPSPQPEPALTSAEMNRRISPTTAMPAGGSASKGSEGSTSTSIAALLSHPRNTLKTALGKPTESAQDMTTPLVCILIPSRTQTTAYAPVSSFFYNVNKNWAMGRAVDVMVDAASQFASAVSTTTPWKAYVLPVPMPMGATPPMYPAEPLSTVVRNSALGRAQHSIVFISCLPGDLLPEEAVKAAADAQRGNWKTNSDESCVTM